MLRIAIALIAFMAVKVLGLRAPIAGYAVVDIVWAVDAFGNGTIVNITGPVQNVYAELEKINPDIVKNINTSSPDELAIRSQDGAQGVRCDASLDPNNSWWQPAILKAIEDDIYYLRHVPGKPQRGPGPGSCGRVSCSYKSAIWWCNDSRELKILDSFTDIAECAQHIVHDCKKDKPPRQVYTVLGQNFQVPGDWNCITRWDDDNC